MMPTNGEFNIENYDLSMSSIHDEYPPKCFPDKFKKSTGYKAKEVLLVEQIDTNKYEEDADMVAFKITRQRLYPWITTEKTQNTKSTGLMKGRVTIQRDKSKQSALKFMRVI